ncbi:MAG: polyprenyl synthetase family protein [Candidatus Gastranaerophilales bacterium]|nr:polyprenyl synthetase family protein [Candidatus Gastranaerophilales bacterium]
MEIQAFQTLLRDKTSEVEAVIRSYLPREEGYQKTVLEAMNYSLLAGGKRLRPLFMSETYRMFGGQDKTVEPFMAAIEMIHTYSLVHDDLPAMDNDEYRRGRETTWKVYGDGMGILAGDGLLNLAFETALSAFDHVDTPDGMRAVAKAVRVLAHKSGVSGMIGGQTADVEAEGQKEPLTMEQLLFIHAHKTAALIQAAMMTGAILAGADEKETVAVEKCAYDIGIAFQIQDDILDVVGDSGELGKNVGSDALNGKQTYVTLNGLERSRQDVERLSREAVEVLCELPGDHGFMEQLILTLIYRTK